MHLPGPGPPELVHLRAVARVPYPHCPVLPRAQHLPPSHPHAAPRQRTQVTPRNGFRPTSRGPAKDRARRRGWNREEGRQGRLRVLRTRSRMQPPVQRLHTMQPPVSCTRSGAGVAVLCAGPTWSACSSSSLPSAGACPSLDAGPALDALRGSCAAYPGTWARPAPTTDAADCKRSGSSKKYQCGIRGKVRNAPHALSCAA